MFIVPSLMTVIEKLHMTPTRTPSKYGLEIALIFLQLYLAIPICLSIYPRMGSISADDLEPEFQNITGEDGERVKEFSFNKGL